MAASNLLQAILKKKVKSTKTLFFKMARGCKWLQVAASGCKWLQVAASGCKWLRVAASDCFFKNQNDARLLAL